MNTRLCVVPAEQLNAFHCWCCDCRSPRPTTRVNITTVSRAISQACRSSSSRVGCFFCAKNMARQQPSQRHTQTTSNSMKLRASALSVLLACLAPSTEAFLSSFRPTSDLLSSRTGVVGAASPWTQDSRRLGPVMAAGEGMGGGRTGGRGKAGRGRGGKGGRKKGKGASKQGTFITGPPRLENVPQDKLDEIFVFREERPGRYAERAPHAIL